MKIDGKGLTPDADPLRRIEPGASKVERSGGERSAPSTDRVDVSEDAKKVQGIIAKVLEAATATPVIRRDVVERARALRESGELGADHEKLADAIIDDLIKRP